MEQKPQKPLNNRELSSFCEQMAMMIKAGIPVSEAVSILKESLEDPDGAAVLESVAKRLEDYGTLYEAFRDSGVFPDYMLDMVHIGEEAGRLDEVFESLSSYYERQESLARSIKSAVTYPCIMIVLMLAVILVLIIKVMPVFNQVYLQLGAQMGGFSRGILDFAYVLHQKRPELPSAPGKTPSLHPQDPGRPLRQPLCRRHGHRAEERPGFRPGSGAFRTSDRRSFS